MQKIQEKTLSKLGNRVEVQCYENKTKVITMQIVMSIQRNIFVMFIDDCIGVCDAVNVEC